MKPRQLPDITLPMSFRATSWLGMAICLLLASCSPGPPGFKEQSADVASGILKSYPALFAVDHQAMGFPPLPTAGSVRILTVDRAGWKLEYPPPNYDVSFQFHTGTSFYPHSTRFIALKRSKDGFVIVSQQMTFNGPRQYELDGQMTNEQIEILNETVGTTISHRKPIPRFGKEPGENKVEGLKPSDVGPVIREWGYDYPVDQAPPPARP
jgi:hypothetical protein